MKLSLVILILIPCLGYSQCDFKLDTVSIVSNRNLPQLIKEIKATNLVKTDDKRTIPAFITDNIGCWFKQSTSIPTESKDSFVLANPGEIYNWSDVIDSRLPSRQINYLAIGSNMLLLNYHYGGIGGGSNHTLIVKFNGRTIEDFLVGRSAKLKSKEAIARWLQKYKNDKQDALFEF